MSSTLLIYQIIIGLLIFFVCILLFLFFFPYQLRRKYKAFNLERHFSNPLLAPQHINEWENMAVFNPAAVIDDEGFVHLLYRALGMGGVSQVGHAASKDGFNFEKRSNYPVYSPPAGYGHADPMKASGPTVYSPWVYTSGGGWGGCEDPRAVRINDRIYMSYTAFEGWHSVRIALTSIAVDDLKKSRWNWKRPIHLSAPGTVEKNWVLFPELFNGKFAVLHSVSPDIKIDYVSNLDSVGPGKYIKSQNSPTRGGRETHWDNWMRGAAAPPMKTKDGWLLLYHAMDRLDPDKYKLGAMLLDLHDPTKILYRSPEPILSPETYYENDWKPGVIYASGAVIIDDPP
ncbi:hypothetical protein KW790_01165, partial [Candidatus Parcubacteria bacterium]|nr:hypothetical protein [Candidatus Parcubacteria bacterium]